MDARPFGFFDFARSWRHFLLRSGGCALAGLCGLILLLLPGCDGLGLVGGNGGPRLTEIPGKIVYSKEVATGHNGDTSPQIFVTDQKGTRQLTFAEEPYHFGQEPAFSPDGTQIVFASGRRSLVGSASLYLMDADGSNKRPLKEYPGSKFPLSGSHPAWSPDGRYIAYDRCLNCEAGGRNHDIFVFDLEADTTRQLSHHPVGDRLPTWSPDGEQIAFVSNRDYFDADSARYRQDLYVVDADGSSQRRLTTTGDIGSPIWSPVENTIFYRSEGPRLSMINLENRKVSQIEIDLPPRTINLFPEAWSPKGTRLLLTAHSPSDSFLYVVNIKTGRAKHISVGQEGVLNPFVDWFMP